MNWVLYVPMSGPRHRLTAVAESPKRTFGWFLLAANHLAQGARWLAIPRVPRIFWVFLASLRNLVGSVMVSLRWLGLWKGFLKPLLKGIPFAVWERGKFDFDHHFAFLAIFLKKCNFLLDGIFFGSLRGSFQEKFVHNGPSFLDFVKLGLKIRT